MATIGTHGKGSEQKATQGQQAQGPFTGETVNIAGAFGLSGDSTRAGLFVAAVKEQFEKNNTTAYKVGTIDLASDNVSIAYLSFMYKDTPVCALALFETNVESIISYQENNRQRYTTVASMVDTSHIETCQKAIQAQCGYQTLPVFVTMHVIPRNIDLSSNVVMRISAQLVTSIESRGDRIGTLKMAEFNKYCFNFFDNAEGVALDSNGIPQRADWNLQMSAVAGDNTQNVAPVLETSKRGNLPADVVSVGYVNLRYTGPKENPKDFIDRPASYNPEQLSPEMVLSQIDAVSAGIEMSLERSILMLNGAGKAAQVGGWFAPLLASIKGSKRKLSALAQHLLFVPGQEIDFKSFDKNPEVALKMLCKKTAAVVVKYRKGDGIGGLSTLLAEIAYGQTESMNILLGKLNKMFEREGMKKFSDAYMEELREANPNKKSFDKTDFVATAVPSVAGSYQGANGLRSLDDMDLLEVTNRIGDQFEHFRNYVTAASYDNRRLDVEEIMIYLHGLAHGFYGANALRISGDALDMVISPKFLALLDRYIEATARCEYNGVIESELQAEQLFVAGTDYAVAGVNAPSTHLGYGGFNVQSGLKF